MPPGFQGTALPAVGGEAITQKALLPGEINLPLCLQSSLTHCSHRIELTNLRLNDLDTMTLLG